MFFGMKPEKEKKGAGPSGPSGGVKKPKKVKAEPKPVNTITSAKKLRYLIYDSKDPDPVVRAKEEKVYRTFFVYPGTNDAIEDPSRNMLWFFYDNPYTPPDSYAANVSNPTSANSKPIGLKLRTWTGLDGKKKKADVVCAKLDDGRYYSILYQGSTGPGQVPYFYIEVYDPETGKATKKMYGMLATSFTPPGSPMRSPPRSPRGSQFGKRKPVKRSLRSLKRDLKKVTKV